MTKTEIMERYEAGEIKTLTEMAHFVKTMSIESTQPTELKKGDVVVKSDGFKKRPFVVYSNKKGLVTLIPISTKNDCLSIAPYNSRFFGNHYFTKSIISIKEEHLKGCFVAVLDDNNGLNKAFKLIKNHVISL
jgi:hypothetical protein